MFHMSIPIWGIRPMYFHLDLGVLYPIYQYIPFSPTFTSSTYGHLILYPVSTIFSRIHPSPRPGGTFSQHPAGSRTHPILPHSSPRSGGTLSHTPDSFPITPCLSDPLNRPWWRPRWGKTAPRSSPLGRNCAPLLADMLVISPLLES